MYGFVTFHQTTPVTLMYFWQKALFQILDSMGMVLSGPIRWVSIIPMRNGSFNIYLWVSGTGI